MTQLNDAPTHRCKICGALWWKGNVDPVGMSWSLRSPTCGKCCDNVAMGDQIEPLSAIVALIEAAHNEGMWNFHGEKWDRLAAAAEVEYKRLTMSPYAVAIAEAEGTLPKGTPLRPCACGAMSDIPYVRILAAGKFHSNDACYPEIK